MILCKPSYEILTPLDGLEMLELIERAGRTCYKSEDRITDDSAGKFCELILRRDPPHESVIEHANLTVQFIANRGFTHELVRHRLASYSQESTRYCNYKGGVTFVIPPWVNTRERQVENTQATFQDDHDLTPVWINYMLGAEKCYKRLLKAGWTPQQARGVLPIDLKTEIVMTANVREWRHVFKMRCSKQAHPQMRELMIPLRDDLRDKIPVLFDDLKTGIKDA